MPINFTTSQNEKDKLAIKADNIFQAVVSKSYNEITQYFDNNLSALAGMTDVEIDSYIDNNINNMDDAKNALKVLAKDSAFNSTHIKMLAKVVAVIARRI